MDHGPNITVEEKDELVSYKTRLGLKLFFVYGLIYAVFVLVNTIAPSSMETPIFFGLNLAVVYGFGLIILAIIMGLIYNALCSKQESIHSIEGGEA